MTISEMSTEDFSFDPRKLHEFLILARRNEEAYRDTGKDPKKEARLDSLRFRHRKIRHTIGPISTNPALVMVVVSLGGTEECLIAFDSKTGRLLEKAIHFTDSPEEWEAEMCFTDPNVLALRFL